FLCYEDMTQDLPETVRRIAQFIGCTLDDELLNLIVRQASVEFMHAHQRQFDDHLIQEARNAACGLPPGGESSKVRKGNVGEHVHELPPEIIDELGRIWRNEVAARISFPSYAALRATVPR
ncbi:MAG: sulfotransferase domain-containing protein, partial [Candidatus Binatia bacterium]